MALSTKFGNISKLVSVPIVPGRYAGSAGKVLHIKRNNGLPVYTPRNSKMH